jgi:hypothetical protein
MNKNDYYSKYLKYKMKYLREKEMQIGGMESMIQINYGDEYFHLVIETTKNVLDIKERIFKLKGIPVLNQRLVFNKMELKNDELINTFYKEVRHLGIIIYLVVMNRS